MDLKQRATRLVRDIPVVWACLRSPHTPWPAKLAAGLTVAYALSPIDLIPDFVPVLGYLDDLIVLPALIALTLRLLPAELVEQQRRAAAQLWQSGQQKKWYYALPVLAVWALAALLIVKALWL